MNRKSIVIVSIGITLLFVLITSISWINAYNGLKTKSNESDEKKALIIASLSTRYDKMDAFIDALEFADETITNYMTIIKEGRQALRDSGTINNEALDGMETNYYSLLTYMGDNPASYQINGLISNYLSEISATNNTVLFSITTYNTAVKNYNNHIEVFPNMIFLRDAVRLESYVAPNYNKELPTFN